MWLMSSEVKMPKSDGEKDTGRQTGRHTDRQTGRQAYRDTKTDKQTHTGAAKAATHAKERFLATKGFSTKLPSSLIFSRAFSAAAALPDCAPPDSR